LLALLICGTLAIVDSGAELAYLGIPKKEEFQATGCCPLSSADRSQVPSAFNESDGRIVEAAFFATSLGMALALLQVSRNAILTEMASFALAAAGALTFLVGREFLIEVGAPVALHLPYHHCPYDLIGGASETLLGIGAFAWGTLSVGWVCLASRYARDAETERVLPAIVGRIAFIGFCCYLSAASMAAVELTLA
jgi:Ca2+/Na+ antiporter